MQDKNNKESSYLTEDQDLLDSLEKVGPAYNTDQRYNQQLSSIQIKSILRSRKTMVDLDKSNKKYSIVILFFAIIQICIAMNQLVLELKVFPDQIFAFITTVSFFGFLYLLAKQMLKTQKNELESVSGTFSTKMFRL